MKYSLIVPVYNRPDEIEELLESLMLQKFKDFEVIVVEDGSKVTCKHIVDKYFGKLNIKYFEKGNQGPGPARNYGAQMAGGDYFIVLDSDVTLPENYLMEVDKELNKQQIDAFGGPDRASDKFTDIQKAITYAMTSFFTTGGIRGGKKKLDKFFPRSFNMGVRRDVWQKLNGFAKMRFGEDIDFSIRIFKNGYIARLLPNAWVYHKRRTDFRKFFRQVFNSGMARITLFKKYPDSLKFVHLLPMFFTLGVVFLILVILAGIALVICNQKITGNTFIVLGVLPLIIYSFIIFFDASHKYKSLKVGFLSVCAAFIQLLGYGLGFITAWYKKILKGEDDFKAFEKNYYK